MPNRKCIRCKQVKPISEFEISRIGKRGGKLYKSYCKPCCREMRRGWAKENPDKIKEYRREDYLKHKDRYKSRSALYYKGKIGKKRQLFHSSKSRAKRNNIEWDLTMEDVMNAPVFDPVGAINWYSKRGDEWAPSLDRINSDGGYTKDNICIIPWCVNAMKGNRGWVEVSLLAQYIDEMVERGKFKVFRQKDIDRAMDNNVKPLFPQNIVKQ